MIAQAPSYCMWALGVEPRDVECIRACMGDNHRLAVLPDVVLPSLEEAEKEDPVLLWIGQRCWRRLVDEGGIPVRYLEYVPRVLVLPRECPPCELKEAVNSGFQEVLLGTERTERIHEILRRSLEWSNMRRDMERMSREIMLDRELLLRKGDVFAFLRDFVSRVSASGETPRMLAEARDVLGELLPITAMHTAIWGPQRSGTVPMHLYLEAPETDSDGEPSDTVRAWTELLLGTATALAPFGGATPCLCTHYSGLFPGNGLCEAERRPDMCRTLLLPLCLGEVFCGVIALLLEREYPLGRDQVSALDAATKHLAVLLRSGVSLEGNFVPESTAGRDCGITVAAAVRQ